MLPPSSANPFVTPSSGWLRDVADRARQRAEPNSVPCGPRSTSTRLDVEEVEVRREQRERDDRLVEVDADLLLHAGLVAHDLAGRDAAHGDLALAGAEVLHA